MKVELKAMNNGMRYKCVTQRCCHENRKFVNKVKSKKAEVKNLANYEKHLF